MRGMLLRAGLHFPGEHPDITKRRDTIGLLSLRLLASIHEKQFGETDDTRAALSLEPLTIEYLIDNTALYQSDDQRERRNAEAISKALGLR